MLEAIGQAEVEVTEEDLAEELTGIAARQAQEVDPARLRHMLEEVGIS